MLQVIRLMDQLPTARVKAVYLAGPVPRGPVQRGWHDEALGEFRTAKFDAVVVDPRPRVTWPVAAPRTHMNSEVPHEHMVIVKRFQLRTLHERQPNGRHSWRDEGFNDRHVRGGSGGAKRLFASPAVANTWSTGNGKISSRTTSSSCLLCRLRGEHSSTSGRYAVRRPGAKQRGRLCDRHPG
jgi:hypothetical protein